MAKIPSLSSRRFSQKRNPQPPNQEARWWSKIDLTNQGLR
jgi:hypothetical protein